MSMTLEQALEANAQLQRELAVKNNQVNELVEALNAAGQREQRLQAEIKKLLKRLYGPKSEAFHADPNQLLLDELLAEALEQAKAAGGDLQPDDVLPEAEALKPRPRRRHKHGRIDLETLEDTLDVQDIIVDVDDDQKICPETGEAMIQMGQEVTRKLEIIPGRIIIKRFIRPKYVSPPAPQSGVVMAQLPAFPIPKCLLGVGLIADILVSKYTDHKPLYRIERTFKREAVHLPRSTMSAIAVRCGVEVFFSLYECLIQHVLSRDYIFSDDTRMPMQMQHLSPAEREEIGSPSLWVYGNAIGPRQVFYDFTLNRTNEGPQRVLANYNGYLQADAYAGYDVVFNNPKTNAVEVGCWAHGRRKFNDALDSSPRLGSEVLASVRELFLIERRADQGGITCADERLAIRREHAKPILEALYPRMAAMRAEILPKSPIATAITYAINQRGALTRFLDDGRLRLDNNWAENHMRPMALGRKNYLFVGSPRGGRAAAVIYSFTESCRLVDVNPVHYFKDVLWRIASHPTDRLEELLPCNWQPGPPVSDRIIMPPMVRGADRTLA